MTARTETRVAAGSLAMIHACELLIASGVSFQAEPIPGGCWLLTTKTESRPDSQAFSRYLRETSAYDE
jgi:hypothetical protein